MTEAPSLNDYLFSVQGHTPYRDVLQKVQQYMSKEYADLFSKQELTKEDTFLIKKNIENYLIEASINCNESKNLTELTDRLYKDMVLYSFLTDYLSPEKVEELGLEEINVNSWECIFLLTSKKGKIRLEEQFLSPQHAADVMTRMLRHSGMVIDDAKPVALGHIAKNVRIAVLKTPVLDEEIGVSCSIRIVSFSKLTRHNLVKEYETIPEKALDFLESCMRYGVSICVAGETGSGKTGTVGYVLSSISANAEKRVITVEEGSREFDLIRRDENGRVKNDVVHLLTRPSENEKQNISQDYLLETILRLDPDVVGVGEMRSHEAITAAEASRTGHTVATTTHSYSAPDTYERLVELAQKVSRASEDALYRKMIGAFPIIVYQEKLTDGSRKVTEIIEGESYKNGEPQYRTLWSYEITDNYIDENNQPKVVGSFIEGEKISDRLRSRLIKKGMAKSVADQY